MLCRNSYFVACILVFGLPAVGCEPEFLFACVVNGRNSHTIRCAKKERKKRSSLQLQRMKGNVNNGKKKKQWHVLMNHFRLTMKCSDFLHVFCILKCSMEWGQTDCDKLKFKKEARLLRHSVICYVRISGGNLAFWIPDQNKCSTLCGSHLPPETTPTCHPVWVASGSSWEESNCKRRGELSSTTQILITPSRLCCMINPWRKPESCEYYAEIFGDI